MLRVSWYVLGCCKSVFSMNIAWTWQLFCSVRASQSPRSLIVEWCSLDCSCGVHTPSGFCITVGNHVLMDQWNYVIRLNVFVSSRYIHYLYRLHCIYVRMLCLISSLTCFGFSVPGATNRRHQERPPRHCLHLWLLHSLDSLQPTSLVMIV